MSWFGWLTGESKTAKKVVQGVIDAGDALFYTDEEKAKDYTNYRKWYLKYLEATQPQNITRRMIATIVTVLWCVIIASGIIAQGFGNKEFAEYVFRTLSENINQPFSIIIGFYFLKHVVSNFKKK